MFIGHYAVGFALKKESEEVPLWLLFVCVQLFDIIVFSLAILGVERIAYNPSDNPFFRTMIEYAPYSHSLIANMVLAMLIFLLFKKIRGRKWGIIIGAAVISHWFLDVIVHKADMPLFHDSFMAGFGLWHYPWVSFFFELTLLGLAGYYLLKNYHRIRRYLVLLALLAAGFCAMFFAPEAEATPFQASVMSLSLYALFSVLAYWSERGGK